MNKALSIIVCGIILTATALGQGRPESLFGLNTSADRWSRQTDRDILGADRFSMLGMPTDIASIHFAAGHDTTEIILVADYLNPVIHWFRAGNGNVSRAIQRRGVFGADSIGMSPFGGFSCLAVASRGYLYNPQTDRIYAGDRMNHRLVVLNFGFNAATPAADQLTWQTSITVDDNFGPRDMEYVNYRTRSRADNRLLVLDDIGQRLLVFGDNGTLLAQYNLSSPADTSAHPIYEAFTCKLNADGVLSVYLADKTNADIWLYTLSPQLEFVYVNRLNIGDRRTNYLADITNIPILGLWAIESEGPHFYRIADDLSQIQAEINSDAFAEAALYRPHKIVAMTERLAIFEQIGDSSGIVTFALNEPAPKEPGAGDAIIPYEFSLEQNYPNPFNISTVINYSLMYDGPVNLTLYNILGQKVATLADDIQKAGPHSIHWRADDIASGIYFARLKSGGETRLIKMVLLK
jgi:hypothetical protein